MMSGASLCGVIPRVVASAVGHRFRVADRRQLDDPDPVRELAGQLGADLHCHARLADSADAGQRDESAFARPVGDLAHQFVAADERGDLPGQVPGQLLGAAQHRELGREPLGHDLEYGDPSAQPTQNVFAERAQRHAGA